MTNILPSENAVSPLDPRESASQFLLRRINYERSSRIPYGKRHMKLDRMRDLLNRLGSPDAGLPIVHVAGTKGKGSTSAMIAGILHAAGYTTGLFTSPHLECITERFVVDGLPCPAVELADLVEQLRPIVAEMDREAERDGELGPTYFELTTAIALMYFAARNVDIAVLEVGLGGRLDSTNVCQPAITVITNISLDHTKQLGSTVEQIAAEKAGIVKPGVPLLCGVLEPGPRDVIAEVARRHGCRMVESGRDFSHTFQKTSGIDQQDSLGRLDFSGDLGSGEVHLLDIRLRLLGKHQAANAALAIAVCARLRRQGWIISNEAIRQSLSALSIPGRTELVSRHPCVVLDVAHNVASVAALVDALVDFSSSRDWLLVLAATKEKDIHGMARLLAPRFQTIILTKYQDNPRAVETDRLAKVFREVAFSQGLDPSRIDVAPTPYQAWQRAMSRATGENLICVTGSFFVVAELRSRILADVQPTEAAARRTGGQ